RARTRGSIAGNRDPRQVLTRWQELPKAERKPGAVQIGDKGKSDPTIPTPPKGGLILQVYESRLTGSVKGEVGRRKKHETFSWGEYEPGRDQIWLSEADWKSLVPAEPKKGKQFELPASVAGRII